MAKQYFNVATHQKNDSAEMYIFGYIGQTKNPWMEDDETEELTDLAIIKALQELEHFSRIDIYINSPGGSIFHGDAIIHAIKTCQSEIHLHNIGIAASMAFQIWLSVPKERRHMAKNAKAMVHSAMTYAYGNSADLRNEANTLDVFDAALIENMVESTGMKAEDIKAQYFDGKDHWLSAANCVELGLIDAPEDSSAVQPIPDGMEQMNYRELVLQYTNGQRKRGSIVPQSVQNFFALFSPKAADTATATAKVDRPEAVVIPELITTNKMDINELKNAVSKGDISAAQLTEYVASLGYNVEKQAAPPDPAIAALTSKVDSIVAALEKIGAAPGAAQTRVAANGDEEKQVDAYAEYQNKMAELALSGDKVKFDN
jgi:ATP-dependent Clp protease protease subunit